MAARVVVHAIAAEGAGDGDRVGVAERVREPSLANCDARKIAGSTLSFCAWQRRVTNVLG